MPGQLDEDEPTDQMTIYLPRALKEWIKKFAKGSHQSASRVGWAALRLFRDKTEAKNGGER